MKVIPRCFFVVILFFVIPSSLFGSQSFMRMQRSGIDPQSFVTAQLSGNNMIALGGMFIAYSGLRTLSRALEYPEFEAPVQQAIPFPQAIAPDIENQGTPLVPGLPPLRNRTRKKLLIVGVAKALGGVAIAGVNILLPIYLDPSLPTLPPSAP